jgi:iron-sulfur cluster repair protein YtfE (RIC family)
MRATDLLKKQHQEAKALIDRLENGAEADRQQILAELSAALRAHAQTEEEIFYPKLEDHTETRDVIEESYEDHEELKAALSDLERCPVDDEDFLDRVQAVEDLMVGHVKDEEGILFPKVEAFWTDEMLRRIGDEMSTRFEELVSGGPEVRV